MSQRLVRWLVWIVGGVVALTVATLALVPDIDVRIEEDRVRDAIDARIPLTQETGLGTAEVNRVRVRFIGDGESGAIGIEARIAVESFGLGGKGEADTVSRLRYENGAFYLTDLRLDDFELEPTAATRVKLLAWKKAVETFLDELGEEIRTEDGEAAFEEFLKNREALGPLLRTALDDALGSVAVYRLDRSPAQSVVWLVLKDVRFEDGVAVATLSPAQAILTLATGFLLALVAGLLVWAKWSELRRPSDDEAY